MYPYLASVYHTSVYYGGNEHYLAHLATALTQKNIPVVYSTGSALGHFPYRLNLLPTKILFNQPIPGMSWLKPIPSECDLYHASGSGLPLIAQAQYLKTHRPSLPRILTYQADSHPKNILNQTLIPLEQWLIGSSFNHIIVTTPTYQSILNRRWPHIPIYFIPLFLSPPFLKLSPKDRTHKYPQLLFVGQLDSHHYYKGLDTLLQTMTILPKHITLNIAGGGDKLNHYQSLCQKLKITTRCHFLGEITHKHLPAYYRQANLFILPSSSNSEGFGMACLEAMSQKTPVITTSIIGSAAYFQKYGVADIVSPNDPFTLACAIKYRLNHRNLSTLKKAYEFAHHHSLDQMVSKTLKLYAEILNHA